MHGRFIAITFLMAIFITPDSMARDWKAIKIPGAKCANGSDYKIWIDKKSDHKLAIEFMGGGACWSRETCFGRRLRAWIFPIITTPRLSVFSSEKPHKSPAHDASMIYFPYCTGDIHVGNHLANYDGHNIYHYGKRNFILTMNYLKNKKILNLNKFNDLLLYGGSAGALASLAHANALENFIPNAHRRTLIADSAGLHWGDKFWDKFSDKIFEDLKNGFNHLAPINKGDGYMARHLPKLCSNLSKWNVGFLQASRDIVMSKVFGNISQKDHEKLVYNKTGITTQKISNCSSFVVQSQIHTFLIAPFTATMEVNNTTAIEYMFNVYRGKTDINYY